LVLQGGGALGAYQVGVYQALHEAGVDPVVEAGSAENPRASAVEVRFNAEQA
jgi:hypothetical protein